MKKLLFLLLVAFVAMPVMAQLSEAEKDFAIKYLTSTHEDIVNTASELSDEAWNYTPKEGGWSAANCLEHILITEQAFFGMAQGTLQSEVIADLDMSGMDGMLIGMLANRGTKVTTAPQFEPSGKWNTKAEMLAALEASREALINFIETTDADARHHKAALPFGEVDAYQLFLIISAHSQRHTAQMKEVLGEYSAM
ncbi:MAG: DinB family protein [Balneolaceae bacterium]